MDLWRSCPEKDVVFWCRDCDGCWGGIRGRVPLPALSTDPLKDCVLLPNEELLPVETIGGGTGKFLAL